MSILLIRHGETAGNAKRVIQLPEIPLSERGIAQAERLGARLARHEIASILSSDHVRAQMTAQQIEAATGVPISLDADLRERNFGDLRGTAYADLVVDLFAPGYVPPGGESWDDLHARADTAWAKLVEVAAGTPHGDVAVVTHGLVLHSIVSRHLAFAPGVEPPMGFSNTSVTIVDADPPWTVSLVDCTRHLDAETAHDRQSRSGL